MATVAIVIASGSLAVSVCQFNHSEQSTQFSQSDRKIETVEDRLELLRGRWQSLSPATQQIISAIEELNAAGNSLDMARTAWRAGSYESANDLAEAASEMLDRVTVIHLESSEEETAALGLIIGILITVVLVGGGMAFFVLRSNRHSRNQTP